MKIEFNLSQGSKLVSTAYPFTFLLATEGTSDVEGSEIFVTADSEKSKDAWKRALEMQIIDCGEIPYRHVLAVYCRNMEKFCLYTDKINS